MDRVLKIEPINTKKLQITLESGLQFCLYRNEVKRLGWEEDSELSTDEYETLCCEVMLPRCKKRIAFWLQSRDISSFEVRKKLHRQYPQEVVDAAISWYCDRGYIDDTEYGKNLIEQWSSRYSRRKIQEKLYLKGFPNDFTATLFEESNIGNEQKLICQYLKRKRIELPISDAKERDRLIRRLLGQGFRWSDVRSVLEAAEQELNY